MGRTEEEQYLNDVVEYMQAALPENPRRRAAVLRRLGAADGRSWPVRWAAVALLALGTASVAGSTFGERVAASGLYEVRLVETTSGGLNVVIANIAGQKQRLVYLRPVTNGEAQQLLQTPRWTDAVLKDYN
jgi:hypothetical protein